jgi:SNF2 family DNA or RNA helicase
VPDFVVRAELNKSATQVIIAVEGFGVGEAAGILRSMTPDLKHTNPRGLLQVPVSWPLVVQLANVLGPKRLTLGPNLKAWSAVEVQRRGNPSELLARVTPGAPAPRDYQELGARMIAAEKRVMLFDEPGCGKTLASLLGMMELRVRGKLTGPILAVVPASTMDDWVAAAQRWTPFVPIAYRGTPGVRKKLLHRGDLIVASYEVVSRDFAKGLADLNPQAMIIDEIGWCCHPDTQRSRAVRTLSERAEFIVGLSGTPITHTPKDLWSALYALSPVAFPSKERYIKRFLDDEGSLTTVTDPEFRRCLYGQQRRVAKADVLTQLPPKNYTTRYVELPPAAREVYDSMENDMVAEVEGGEITAMGALAMLTRLNQLAAATGVVSTKEVTDRKGTVKVETHVQLVEPSWKVDVMMEVLAERDGHQTTVFSPSRQLVMLAGKRAEKEGLRVGYIVGEQKPAERTQQIEAFQDGKLDVMMATVGAGGIGITLTAASAVIFLQRPWSATQSTQAEDRQHRLGSERHGSIDVIDIVAKDTVDSRVRGVLRDKHGALAALLQDPRILSECLGGK